MARRISTLTLSLALVLVGMATVSGPATAERWSIPDRYDPGRLVHDMSRLTVAHAPRNLFVRTRFRPRVSWVNINEAWIDTRARNPGPEFVVSWHDRWPRMLSVHRVHRWNWRHATQRRCPRARANRTRRAVVFRVPRRCLRIRGRPPVRVRVTVHAYDVQFPGRTSDWAPRWKRFGKRFVRAA